MANTTYTKLRSGEWGVRVEGAKPSIGATVHVTKRDGTAKTETIGAIVWSGEGVTLCAVASTARPTASRRTGAWRPCGYPGCSPGYCDDCDGAGAGRGEW
jgi:hypothetical protein